MTAGLYVARTFLNPILSNLVDPDKEKHEQARRQAKAHLERLSRQRRVDDGTGEDDGSRRRISEAQELVLNEFENLVALEMVAPEDIHVGFDGQSMPWLVPLAVSADNLTSIPINRYWRT